MPAMVAACAVSVVAWLVPAQAQTFTQALSAALSADAQYTAAMAGISNRRLQSREVGMAYYPSANLSYSQGDIGGSARGTTTISVTQPVASYDRWLALQQSNPLLAQAEAETRQARSELSLRVFRAMSDIVRSRESIRAIEVQLRGLNEQLQRARRMRELGQGTITEVIDFEVRLAVAEANLASLLNTQQAAVRALVLVSGLVAQPDAVNLDDTVPGNWQPAVDEASYAEMARAGSTAVLQAREALRLQEIAGKRVRARYLPELYAGSSYTSGPSGSSTGNLRVGITLSVPVSAGSWFDDQRAANDLIRARENLRFAQENATNEAIRLWRGVESLKAELAIRERAVDAARLALEANIRSYQGGIKSNIDVVTSYQTLADAQTALAGSRLALQEARLSQRLLTGP